MAVAALAAPRNALRLAAVALAGSVLGLLVALSVAGRLPQPLVTARMHTAVSLAYDQHTPFDATREQAWSGIPGKAYAAEAGRRDEPVLPTVAGWVVGRGRPGPAGRRRRGASSGSSPEPCRWRRVLLLSGFAVGWARVLTAWS